jgi:hypothetical protein
LLFLDVRRDANLSQFVPSAVSRSRSRHEFAPGSRPTRSPGGPAVPDEPGAGLQPSRSRTPAVSASSPPLRTTSLTAMWMRSRRASGASRRSAKASRSRFRPYSVSGSPSTTSPALRPSKRARRRSLGLGSPERGIGERRARKPTWLRAIRLGSAQIGALRHGLVPARRRGRMPERPALISALALTRTGDGRRAADLRQ